MLINLKIRNFILLKNLEIDFKNGLTVITGETGSGKSMIIDALRCLTQKRVNIESLCNNNENTQITALFDISQNLDAQNFCKENYIEFDDDVVILKKVISEQGKSKNFINAEPVSVKLLNKLAELLIEIHGQFDNNVLFDESKHINFIDSLLLEQNNLAILASLFQEYNAVKEKYRNAQAKKEQLKVRIVELEAFLTDFANVDLSESYYENMLIKKNSIKQQMEVADLYDEVNKCFSAQNSITDKLLALQRYLIRNKQKDEQKTSLFLDKIEQQLMLADEILAEANVTGVDVAEKEDVEVAISRLKQLARKYNLPADNLYDELCITKKKLVESKQELLDFENLGETLSEKSHNFKKYADKIAVERLAIITKIENLVMSNLADLQMKKTAFKIEIKDLAENKWNKQGTKFYEFFIKTNLDQPYDKLNKIASGGELSRFMLSLKIALNTTSKTLIFDEVDTGISGKAAHLVALKLKEISKKNQIFIITHQAQVAAISTNHLKVIKHYHDNISFSNVKILNYDEKLNEIATMISGVEITKEALLAAKKLF